MLWQPLSRFWYTYFLNFRLALLWFCLFIVMRALVYLTVIFNNFLVFSFSFFRFRAIIYFSLDKYSLSIFDVVLYYQENAFKISKMVQYNHRSLMISVKDAKYIHLLPIFRIFQSFSYCKYKPFINSFQFNLFCYQCWLSYFWAIE